MSNNTKENRRMGARTLKENERVKVTGGSSTLASELGTGPISNPDSILDT